MSSICMQQLTNYIVSGVFRTSSFVSVGRCGARNYSQIVQRLIGQRRSFSSETTSGAQQHHSKSTSAVKKHDFKLPFPYFVSVKVRGYELDSFGHVNNAVYLNWLEVVRWELMTHGLKQVGYGTTQSDLLGVGVLPVVRKVELDYLAETKMGDVIKIGYWPRFYKTTSFNMGYQMVIVDSTQKERIGRTVLKASIIQTCIQRANGKKVPVSDRFKEYFLSYDPGDTIDFSHYEQTSPSFHN
eukprot:TRINITY_DN3421_c0_g1_i1.p1 TRINITY_DN3421_c0_g1~~TRINITY_DN3421_c0_g1_i1.p1  ORF type:complete len:241 (-),score=40.47 TRINITY_DN3421_c0_g1_i1:153-875(-)